MRRYVPSVQHRAAPKTPRLSIRSELNVNKAGECVREVRAPLLAAGQVRAYPWSGATPPKDEYRQYAKEAGHEDSQRCVGDGDEGEASVKCRQMMEASDKCLGLRGFKAFASTSVLP